VERAELLKTANERVSITAACNMIGMNVSDYAAASMKVYCPFGEIFHQDGGMSKSMRIYTESNSAFCFAGCGYFDPVKLISTKRDIPEEAAAEALLEETGYVAPNYQDQWDALMSEKPVVNTADLAEALKVACSRMVPNWEERQFDELVSHKLAQCLDLLRKVHTDDDATNWLDVTKKVMKATMKATA